MKPTGFLLAQISPARRLALSIVLLAAGPPGKSQSWLQSQGLLGTNAQAK